MKTIRDGRNNVITDSNYSWRPVAYSSRLSLLYFVCSAALIGCSSGQPSSPVPSADKARASDTSRQTEEKIAAERLAVEHERAALERQRLSLEQQQSEMRKQATAEAEKQKQVEERSRSIDEVANKVAAAAVDMERKMVSASNVLARTTGGRPDTETSGLHNDVFQEVRVRIISDTQGIGKDDFPAAVQRSVMAWSQEYHQRQVQKRF